MNWGGVLGNVGVPVWFSTVTVGVRIGVAFRDRAMGSELNRFCRWEDWNDPRYRATMRRLMPDLVAADARYPTGYEHRKVWEYAHVLNALEGLNVLRPEALVLSVGGATRSRPTT